MLKTLVTMTLLAVMMSMAACNTIEGVGKDIESAGETIQDAAD